MRKTLRLYLIEILHQTTTVQRSRSSPPRCILSKFYIKPQRLIYQVYLSSSCILSKFYIKPQPRRRCFDGALRCILSKFYIKPQLECRNRLLRRRCILSKFYIKPQLLRIAVDATTVVSYRNSTSNHNGGRSESRGGAVVSYRNSTSNHNVQSEFLYLFQLYLIEILHQTTTRWRSPRTSTRLYLIEILHQTTTETPVVITCSELYLIEILHQTTTVSTKTHLAISCILSKFYIKPQRRASY